MRVRCTTVRSCGWQAAAAVAGTLLLLACAGCLQPRAAGWREAAGQLYAAAATGTVGQARALLAAGALPVYRGSDAVEHGNYVGCCTYECGANVTHKTALHWAAQRRNPELVRLLLAAGADPGDCSSDGQTALHWACGWVGYSAETATNLSAVAERSARAVATARELLQAGADVNARDAWGWQPLHYALFFSEFATGAANEALVRLLVARGADANGKMPFRDVALRDPDTDAAADEGTPLIRASIQHRAELIRLLLSLGADVRKADADGVSALHHACSDFSWYAEAATNTLDCIRLLLQAGADVRARDRKGRTPLHDLGCGFPHEGAADARAEAMRLLVAAGADINARDTTLPFGRGRTPFALLFGNSDGYICHGSDRLRMMKAWLDAGASPNCRLAEGHFPLHRAILGGWKEGVQLLLDHGADVNIRDPQESGPQPTALGVAVFRGNTNLVVELLKRGAASNARCGYGWLDGAEPVRRGQAGMHSGGTPLHMACLFGDTPMARLLLDAGADVNVGNDCNWRPLHTAADGRNLDLAKLLLAHGADVNGEDETGSTPLQRAVYRNDAAMVRLLLEKGAKPNVATVRESNLWLPRRWEWHGDAIIAGITPLHLAGRYADEEIVRQLLQAGARVEARDAEENTAVLYASGKPDTAPLRALLAAGGDAKAVNRRGYTALHFAARGSVPAIELLAKQGVDPNVQNQNGDTPLHVAAAVQDRERVRALLQAGARKEIRNHQGKTPVEIWKDVDGP